MKTNLMRRVYINGKEDLPDEGYFTFHRKGESEWITHYNWFDKDRDESMVLETIDWYLAPVSREEIIKVLKKYSFALPYDIYKVTKKDFGKITDEIIGGVK